jgi:hypothetical protein
MRRFQPAMENHAFAENSTRKATYKVTQTKRLPPSRGENIAYSDRNLL